MRTRHEGAGALRGKARAERSTSAVGLGISSSRMPSLPSSALTSFHIEISGSSLSGWYKTAERSPVVYIQHGHDNGAWANASFRKLLLNAIKWTASAEGKTWAHSNAKRIFV